MNPDFMCLFWCRFGGSVVEVRREGPDFFASLLHLDLVALVLDHLCLLAGPTALPGAEPAGRRGELRGRETTNATPLCKQCLCLEECSYFVLFLF